MSEWFRGRTLRKLVAAAVIGGFVPVATAGCFGTFQLTRKVYQYNKEIDDDKWVQWLMFLVLNFIPVYGFATLFDAIFANSVEFWTGDNPVTAAADHERIVSDSSGATVSTRSRETGVMDLQVVDRDGTSHFLRLVREDESVAAYDRDGRFLMRVGERGGAPAVLARGE